MEAEIQTVAEAGGRSRNRDNQNSTLILGPRDSLSGKLHVEGDLRVQGNVEGELDVTGDVHVDPAAAVQASIKGRNVNVRGQVTGAVSAKERLLLAGSAVVTGDVQVGRLAIEDGATLNGHVTMQASQERGDRGDHRKHGQHQGDAAAPEAAVEGEQAPA